MDEQAQLVAVAGAAAAALVAEMVKGSWSAARVAVTRAFRRAGEEESKRQLSRLDADHARADTLDSSVLRDRWQRRLLTLIEDYPEAADDLAALANLHSDEPSAGVSQTATGNSGPVIQVGRDNFGGLNTGGR